MAFSSRLIWQSSIDNTLIFSSSCRRYKREIADLESDLDLVDALRPVSFTWKASDEEDVGFIAEEVEAVDPRLVTRVDGELAGVKYRQLTAVLVKGLQELRAETERLREENRALEARLSALEAADE